MWYNMYDYDDNEEHKGNKDSKLISLFPVRKHKPIVTLVNIVS